MFSLYILYARVERVKRECRSAFWGCGYSIGKSCYKVQSVAVCQSYDNRALDILKRSGARSEHLSATGNTNKWLRKTSHVTTSKYRNKASIHYRTCKNSKKKLVTYNFAGCGLKALSMAHEFGRINFLTRIYRHFLL